MKTRNEAVGFAQRTRKNLEFMRQAYESGQDVHLVSHVVNSLLGLVVVPQQRYSGHTLWKTSLEDLKLQKWPNWRITLDQPEGKICKTTTLEWLAFHLRNAAAHGRFEFADYPDSRELSDVRLIVKDAPGKDGPVNWKAEIGGEELYAFCLRLADHIVDHLG